MVACERPTRAWVGIVASWRADRAAGEPNDRVTPQGGGENMRKLGFLLAALLSLSFVASAGAAVPGSATIGVDGGASIPLGDFGKSFKTSGMGGAFIEYSLTSFIGLGLDGSYNQFTGKDLPADVSSKFKIWQGGGFVRLSAPTVAGGTTMPIVPYVRGGLGWYRNDAEETVLGVESKTTSNKLGFNLGVGADFHATPQFGVGVFGTWHGISNAFKVTEFDDLGNIIGHKNRMANYVAVGLTLSFSAVPGAGGATTTTP